MPLYLIAEDLAADAVDRWAAEAIAGLEASLQRHADFDVFCAGQDEAA